MCCYRSVLLGQVDLIFMVTQVNYIQLKSIELHGHSDLEKWYVFSSTPMIIPRAGETCGERKGMGGNDATNKMRVHKSEAI